MLVPARLDAAIGIDDPGLQRIPQQGEGRFRVIREAAVAQIRLIDEQYEIKRLFRRKGTTGGDARLDVPLPPREIPEEILFETTIIREALHYFMLAKIGIYQTRHKSSDHGHRQRHREP